MGVKGRSSEQCYAERRPGPEDRERDEGRGGGSKAKTKPKKKHPQNSATPNEDRVLRMGSKGGPQNSATHNEDRSEDRERDEGRGK